MSWALAAITFGGGAAGSLLRHVALVASARRFGRHAWVGLLLVNLLGCLGIGFVDAMVSARAGLLGLDPSAARWALSVGFLGGFTSFSAVSVLSDRLWQGGRRATAVVQAILPVLFAVPAVRLGAVLGRVIGGGP